MLTVRDADTHWRVAYINDGNLPGPRYTELWRKSFPSFDALPKGTQMAVATLRMTRDSEAVPDVGRRVAVYMFWVYDTPELLEEYEEAQK